jgi:hypothetical protein
LGTVCSGFDCPRLLRTGLGRLTTVLATLDSDNAEDAVDVTIDALRAIARPV